MPKRIQRQRTPGWRMPENAVYVGRPTIWGNPYVEPQQAEWVTRLFREYITKSSDDAADRMRANLSALRGKDLACWCRPGEPCHADVLLELANRDP